jgi:hypothetical protein
MKLCGNVQAWSGFHSVSLCFAIALIVSILLSVASASIRARTGQNAQPTNAIFPGDSLSPLDHSHGQKSLLFIRARFPDDPGGALPSDATLNANAILANSDFRAYSYNQFSLTWNVGPVVTLPHPTSYYQGISGRTTAVLADARALALAQGYNYSQYDLNIVYIPRFYGIFTSYLTSDGDWFWLEPADTAANAYGIEGFIVDFYLHMANRANGWQTTDGTVFGNCPGCGAPAASGIADPFDVFGNESTQANYNLFHKSEVGWMPWANIPRITSGGSYRLHAQDRETSIDPTRTYGLRLPGYQGRDYWIEYRQGVGLLVNWGGVLLLDMTPGSAPGFNDAPLLLGRTLTDPNGTSITFAGRGGSNPEYVDLNITIVGSTPTPTPTPNPSPTPNAGPSVGSRVTVDVDGVFVRLGPSIIYAVVGTQGTTSRGTVEQPCVNDPFSPRVFCPVIFDAGVSGSLTIEHVVVLAAPSLRLVTLTGATGGTLLALNVALQTAGSSFPVTTQANFGPDKRTRLIIFAAGVVGNAANIDPTNDISSGGVVIPNVAESIAVEAHTQDGRTYLLPVEFAGGESLVAGLDNINVVLIQELQGAGLVDLTLIVNGQRSNSPTIVVL